MKLSKSFGTEAATSSAEPTRLRRLVRPGFAVGAVLFLTLGFATPSLAADTPPPTEPPATVVVPNTTPEDQEPGQEIRLGHTLDDSTLIGITGEESVQPLLLDPVDVLNCQTLNNADHVVKPYDVFWPTSHPDGSPWIAAGAFNLKCGTAYTNGWKHIQDRHQYSTSSHPNSWESIRAAAASVGGNPVFAWDDYMDHAIQDTIDYPMPVPRDIGSNKACFSTIFHIWVGETPKYSWYVNSIMSVNNRLVISAYPSDNALVSDCVD